MAGPGPGDQDEHYDFLFKLVLVGDASVGKTCVVQRFKTGAFSARQGSTIGVDFTMKTLEIQGKRVKVGGGAARCFCSPAGGSWPVLQLPLLSERAWALMSALGSGPKAPPWALGVVTVGGRSVEEEACPRAHGAGTPPK